MEAIWRALAMHCWCARCCSGITGSAAAVVGRAGGIQAAVLLRVQGAQVWHCGNAAVGSQHLACDGEGGGATLRYGGARHACNGVHRQ